MSNLNMRGVRDYWTAERFLHENRINYSRVLCYATTIRKEITADGYPMIVVRHHATDIIRYFSDGRVEIQSNGYLSQTTATRLHGMTPASVRVSSAKGGIVESPFYSGDWPYSWEQVA